MILLLSVIIVFNLSPVQAQSKPVEDRKREKFGYTLKQPKRDAQKKTATSEKNQKEPGENLQQDSDIIRVNTLLILSDIQVVDKQGRAVAGLNRNDFIVTEDGAPQEITTFALGDDPDRARSIILIIDCSDTQLPYIDTSVEAAKVLVDKLGQKDKMAIVTDDVALLVDFTQDKEKLKETLQALKKKPTRSSSRQFSALMATLKELVNKNERTLIIFQTDGDELRSLLPLATSYHLPNIPIEFTVADVYREAENSRTTIYPVIPGVRFAGLSQTEQVAQAKKDIANRVNAETAPRAFYRSYSSKETTDERFLGYAQGPLQLQLALESLARITGGEALFLEEPKDASEIYSRILSDINHRYVIGYQPANTERDGKRRKVGIEVRNHPDYVIKGRKSYYAPLPE